MLQGASHQKMPQTGLATKVEARTGRRGAEGGMYGAGGGIHVLLLLKPVLGRESPLSSSGHVGSMMVCQHVEKKI